MTTGPTADVAAAGATLARLEAEIRKAYIGQPALVRGVLLGLLTRGNLLLEGTPGLGKTLLVKVLSEALDLRFSRIQFTPDLMPADITGGPTLVKLPDGANAASLERWMAPLIDAPAWANGRTNAWRLQAHGRGNVRWRGRRRGRPQLPRVLLKPQKFSPRYARKFIVEAPHF